MIDDSLLKKIESGSYSDNDVQELASNYKQLIKDNAELHKKLSAERVFVVNKGEGNE